MAIGVGYHLATGNIPLIYMQNSGLGNIINPSLSLLDQQVYSIPTLLMIGWRGEPEVNDEPQHVKQGQVTLRLLETIDIPYVVLGPEVEDKDVSILLMEMVSRSMNENRCCAIVVKKDTFSQYLVQNSGNFDRPQNREQVIQMIVETLGDQDIVVSTTGVTSRELFEYRARNRHGHEKDFLTVGGMGYASQIALGLALFKPNREVFCLDGDGAMLMQMGGLPINAASGPQNYRHILLNNAAHDSVGGQPTVGDRVDFITIAQGSGYRWAKRAVNEEEIKLRLAEIRKINGPALLEIQIQKGYRKQLGRPTLTPVINKKSFMEFVKNDLQ
jgi:phosphonopyruvate decarboxylase